MAEIPGKRPNLTFFPYVLVRACTHPMRWMDELACSGSAALLEKAFEAEDKLKALQQQLAEPLFALVAGIADRAIRGEALELKRSIANPGLHAPAMLSPGLHAEMNPGLREQLEQWRKLSGERAEMFEQARATFETEYEASRKRLQQLLREPLVQEGILLSSEALYQGVLRYLKNPPKPGEKGTKAQRQLERSAIEHLARACFKTTPRGLLTGVGLARWKEELDQSLEYEPSASGAFGEFIARRRTVLNLPTVRSLARTLSEIGELWKHVVPRPNPSWYREDGQVRFLSPAVAGPNLTELYSLPEQDLINAFLKHTESRRLRAEELIEAIRQERQKESSGEPETAEELTSFYHKLCKVELLIGYLEIPFERQDGLEFLLDWLRQLPEALRPKAELAELSRIQELLSELDGANLTLDDRMKRYSQIKACLAAIDEMLGTGYGGQAVQEVVIARSVLPAAGLRLGGPTQSDLETAIQVSYFLTRSRGQASHESARSSAGFLRRSGFFSENTEKEEEVPLWKLIGFTPPPESVPKLARKEEDIRFREALFARIGAEAAKGNTRAVDLKSDDLLNRLPAPADPKISNGAVQFRVHFEPVEGSTEPIRRIVIEEAREGLNLEFNRFAQTLGDNGLIAELRKFSDWLRPRVGPGKAWVDCIMATIKRADTILGFTLFQPEVVEVFGARSEKNPEQVIPLRDLWIKATPKDGRREAKLIRKRGSQEIELFPHWESMINPESLGRWFRVVALLLQGLGGATIRNLLFWRRNLLHSTIGGHMPRLTFGSVVLSREYWMVPHGELKREEAATQLQALSAWDNFLHWNRWRKARSIPRDVFCTQGQINPYAIDFHNPYTTDALSQNFSSVTSGVVLMTEMLPGRNALKWPGLKEAYAVQFSAGFYSQGDQSEPGASSS